MIEIFGDTTLGILTGFITWAITIATGSVIATLVVIDLGIRSGRKKFIKILSDPEVQNSVTAFVNNHIVKPFNSLDNNSDTKQLIKETVDKTLELVLAKIEEYKKEV